MGLTSFPKSEDSLWHLTEISKTIAELLRFQKTSGEYAAERPLRAIGEKLRSSMSLDGKGSARFTHTKDMINNHQKLFFRDIAHDQIFIFEASHYVIGGYASWAWVFGRIPEWGIRHDTTSVGRQRERLLRQGEHSETLNTSWGIFLRYWWPWETNVSTWVKVSIETFNIGILLQHIPCSCINNSRR